VCLSFSAYHPELWQPAWGIRLILEALISFLPTPADGAVGALDWSPNERKRLATASVKYECPTCGKTADLLPKLDEEVKKTKPQTRFQKEIQQLHMMQMQEHTQDEEEETDGDKEAAEPKVNETENRQGKQTESTKDGALEELPENVPNLEEELQRQQENKPAEPEAEERVVAVPQPGAQPVAQPQVAPEVAATVQPDLYENGSSWLSDPVLQGAIAVLATISFLLLRKVQALIDDLRALE
jgi:ubiquitin-conjugating enzyme E2 J1